MKNKSNVNKLLTTLKKVDSSIQDINQALRHNWPDGNGARTITLTSAEQQWVTGGLKLVLKSNDATFVAKKYTRQLLSRLEHDGWDNCIVA